MGSAGAAGDAPGPGTYYDDMHQLGRGVADRVRGAGASPAFSFGTGPRLESTRRKQDEEFPAAGDYAPDVDYAGGGGGGGRECASGVGSGVAGGNTGGTSVGGYTFGYRRPEGGPAKEAEGRGGAGDGGSEVHRNPPDVDPGAAREGQGPAFTMGQRTRVIGEARTSPGLL